jgi:hypothetical protein
MIANINSHTSQSIHWDISSINRSRFIQLFTFLITFLLIGTVSILLFSQNADAIQYYDVDLSSTVTELDADRKNTADYQVKVTNQGVYDDTYEVTYTNPKPDTWVVGFTDHYTDKLEISVKAADWTWVNMTIRPSCGCEEGNQLVVKVTAKSKEDSTQTTLDKITLTTTYKFESEPPNNGDPDPVDSDGDGWSDDDELFYGTNPYDENDYPVLDKDSDNDGLTDDFELSWGTDPYHPDTDGDGDNDADEYYQGTDPKDPKDNSRTTSSTTDGSDSTNKGSDERNLFGMDIGDNIYVIIIPILIIIVLVSVIILLNIWKSQGPDENERSRSKKDGNLEKASKRNDVKEKANASTQIETLDAKLKRTGGGYECPECSREFPLKSLKKHVLRVHHKRLKRL